MNIVVTGSLGHISKPLTQQLLQQGHKVTVVSSQQARAEAITALGAIPAIGSMTDADFLTQTFKGADIVYAMEALHAGALFDHSINMVEANIQIGRNYKQAIEASGVPSVVHLSSIGAHLSQGNGILVFHYQVEQLLNQLPQHVSIKFMRPVGFYYNMFAFIPSIKATGKIIQNYGGDEKEPWVSPLDIADAIAEEMNLPFNGRQVRYIASDEVSPNEVAAVLGNAIGVPGLQWQAIPDEAFLQNLIAAGMNPQMAKGFTEMNAARLTGLYADYRKHRPVLGKVKLTDFAHAFAAAYKQQ